MIEAPTLEADAARIELAGHTLLGNLSARSSAERLALLGDWSALFRLLAGEAELSAGKLALAGEPAPLGVQRGRIGLMRLDPMLPAAWSGEQLLAGSAELAGMTQRAARRAAFVALEHLGLAALAGRRLGHLQVAERRSLLIAHATLTDPALLCLEQPLAGLDTSAQQLVLAVIGRALTGRRLLVSLADPQLNPGEQELLARSDERLRLAAGVVLGEEARAAPGARVTATVCRNHQAFEGALASRGLRAHPTHEAALLGALTSPRAGPAWRYLVELTDPSTAGILDAALETDAGLIELVPAS